MTFTHTSPHLDQGFPGTVKFSVTHMLSSDNTWSIDYSATTDMDTIISMTNHAYFNLNANMNGEGTVLDHVINAPNAGKYIPVDEYLIPTGTIDPVPDYLNFTSPKALSVDIDSGTVDASGGYDNALLFTDYAPNVSRKVISMHSPITGIAVLVTSDQASVQLYTGNNLDSTIPRKKSQCDEGEGEGEECFYEWRGAATLEMQAGVDNANHRDGGFPSIDVKAGSQYKQRSEYKFGVVYI